MPLMNTQNTCHYHAYILQSMVLGVSGMSGLPAR